MTTALDQSPSSCPWPAPVAALRSVNWATGSVNQLFSLRAGAEGRRSLAVGFSGSIPIPYALFPTPTTLGQLQRRSDRNREARQDGGPVSKQIPLGPTSWPSERWKSLETSNSTETEEKKNTSQLGRKTLAQKNVFWASFLVGSKTDSAAPVQLLLGAR